MTKSSLGHFYGLWSAFNSYANLIQSTLATFFNCPRVGHILINFLLFDNIPFSLYTLWLLTLVSSKFTFRLVIIRALIIFRLVIIRASTILPVFVFFGPALLRALGPQGVVFVHHGGNEIVGFIKPLSWKSFGVHVSFAEVAVMADWVAFSKRPNVSEIMVQRGALKH